MANQVRTSRELCILESECFAPGNTNCCGIVTGSSEKLPVVRRPINPFNEPIMLAGGVVGCNGVIKSCAGILLALVSPIAP